MLKLEEFSNAFTRLGTNVNLNADDIELRGKFTFFFMVFYLSPRSTMPAQNVLESI